MVGQKKWDSAKKQPVTCHCTVCAASLKKFNKIVKTSPVQFCYWSQAKSILQSAVPLNYLLGDPFLGQAQYCRGMAMTRVLTVSIRYTEIQFAIKFALPNTQPLF